MSLSLKQFDREADRGGRCWVRQAVPPSLPPLLVPQIPRKSACFELQPPPPPSIPSVAMVTGKQPGFLCINILLTRSQMAPPPHGWQREAFKLIPDQLLLTFSFTSLTFTVKGSNVRFKTCEALSDDQQKCHLVCLFVHFYVKIS